MCWDADRIWAAASNVIGARKSPALLTDANAIERTGWIAGGLIGGGLFLVTRSFLPRDLTLPLLIAGACAALLVVAGWIVQAFRRDSPPIATD